MTAGLLPPLVDIHAHLYDEALVDEVPALFAEARAAGVVAVIDTASDLATAREVIAHAAADPICWAAVGVHPHDAAKWDDATSSGELQTLLAQPRVVALGEIGLDFHYDHAPRDRQAEVLAAQWRLAAAVGRPVVVHLREAFAAFWATIDGLPRPPAVVLHCFSGGLDEARRALDAGFVLSIGGVLTYKRSEDTRAVFRFAPADRILIETDCPWLAPEPHRGRRNHPALVRAVWQRLAQVRGEDPARLAGQLLDNARRVFGLDVATA